MKHISPGISTSTIKSPDNSNLLISSSVNIVGNANVTNTLTITGSIVPQSTLVIDGAMNVTGDVTFDRNPTFLEVNLLPTTASWAGTASYALNLVNSPNSINTGSFVTTSSFNSFTSSITAFATTGSNQFNGNQTITGSLTITQNLTVLGNTTITSITASQLTVSSSYISVNVFEPAQRFGGLIVYDSGSSQATASLIWDSLNNKWIYQNASGSTYSGGALMSGPRNTGSLGEERLPTINYVLKGQGGDHIVESNIFDDGTKISINSSIDITGSLTVTGNIIGTASISLQTATPQLYAINYASKYILL